MTDAYIFRGKAHKNVLVLNEETEIREAMKSLPENCELLDKVPMYESDIEKVNNFFIALNELAEAYHHMSPNLRERFAGLAGEAVRWNFSVNTLKRAGLLKGDEEHD